MSDWNDCIVTYIDLAFMDELIAQGKSIATSLMENLHATVRCEITNQMPSHSCSYVWNDSALLLANIMDDSTYEQIMREIDTLKKRVDTLRKCYAISVKGQAMPEAPTICRFCPRDLGDPPRFVYIRASSYAFANCFKIETALGHLRKEYYIDSRIREKIPSLKESGRYSVSMLPRNVQRDICVFDEYLWPGPSEWIGSKNKLHGSTAADE